MKREREKLKTSRTRERSWQNEAFELRSQWKKERWDRMMLQNDMSAQESELEQLRRQLDKQNREKEGLVMRNNVLEQELLDLRRELELKKRDFSLEKDRTSWFERRVTEIEIALKDIEKNNIEQTAIIHKFEKK